MNTEIQALLQTFFDKLWVDIESLEFVDSGEDAFSLKIQSPDSGILIGPNGKNIDALQNLLKIMIVHNMDKKIRLRLEINDYSKTRKDRLLFFIAQKIKQVIETWKAIELPYYSGYERKQIHDYVHALSHNKVCTKSHWEWNQRRLSICKQVQKLTIDIDGTDI